MKHEVMGFENLHRHTMNSILDGVAQVYEYAEYSQEVDQKYLCITDHGVMGAIPQQIAASEKYGLSPIFGIEAYINPMQIKAKNRAESADFRKNLSPEEQEKFDKSCHLLMLAYNDDGYANLVQMSSWAWIHGFYRKPRINYDLLQRHKEGIIFTSTCGNSEIANALFKHGEEAAEEMLKQYMAWFGDKFYLELMMLDWEKQKPYDAFLVKMHAKYGVQLILTCDCHVCRKEQKQLQMLSLMMQTDRTLKELKALINSNEGKDLFELQDPNLWMKSERELDEKWESDYRDIIPYELYKQS